MNEKIEQLKKWREPGQSFCPYLFLHYHLDTDKCTKLCCHAQTNINNKRIDFDDKVYNAIREQAVTRNERLTRYCTTCYESEDNGYISLRQRAIDDVITHEQVDTVFDQINTWKQGDSIKPFWYDLRVSNNCNLACVMCGPLYSSTWAEIRGEKNVHLEQEPDIEINPKTWKIQLVGGEPFMIKKYSKMLSQITNTDCHIIVNTNATIITKPLLDQLKRFKNVWITISLDGYGKLNDKIRKNSSWDTIVENIKIFRECGFNLLVNTVLQAYNINHLYELGVWIENNGIDDWIISPLFKPGYLRWQNLDTIDFESVEKTLQLYSVSRNESSTELLKHAIEYMKEKNQ
jgi:organic radical activating enzyme